ncbi:hypothetical protein FOA43_002660 [Brettanomyces nanus]|uniref:Protein disulfide-isomerase n=1 Tax=Eeniella nana TaxID=13502 RepID=A0A875S2X6_EENNA|nr:uncharacterized protein FOA43_002660 [Brettanomyces nanus]QPG75308.1 hypothetical protein FOA43_002660 [Brettanomyces nanus]
MLFTSLVSLLVTSLSVVRGEDSAAVAPEDSAVVSLNADNFEDFVSQHPVVLAEFFAPWCGHCKHLGPEFVAAADVLSKKDIPLAQVDCTEERDLCSKYEVRGYPTLKVFRGSPSDYSDYNGQRKSDSIINYMTKQTLPAVSVYEDAADLLEAISEVKDSFILQVLPKGVTVGNGTFYEIADAQRDLFSFATTSNEEYVKKYAPKSGKKPGYVIFRPDEEISDASVYDDKLIDEEHLNKFIEVETKPLLGELDGSSFRSYMGANLPLAYYFYNDLTQRDEIKPLLSKLAKTYRGKMNFVALDATKYGVHSQNLNMEEKFPLFSIHDIPSNLKYGISQEKELNNKDISSFVTKFFAEKLEPIVKSEPIPDTQNSSVYHLVGYEYEKIVASPKDVFVKYYAPWCGHCKRLAPIYESLADLYAEDDKASGKVLLAEIDHTANDINGVDIQGYPTLILYPADGSDPVLFEGQRTLEGMADFIKENGSTGVDGTALYVKQQENSKDEENEDEDEEVEAEEEKVAKLVEKIEKAQKPVADVAEKVKAAAGSIGQKIQEKYEQAKDLLLAKKEEWTEKLQGVQKAPEEEEDHDEL